MGANLSPEFLEAATTGMTAHGIDGWLLYDFRAKNPIAADLLGLPEGQKRRYFVLLRPSAAPVALVQKIEVSGWDGWPHDLISYVSCDELEDSLRRLLAECDTVAMEVSPLDSIPYVDHVPAGVVDLVETLGPRVVSSVDLISSTAAQWSERGHRLQGEAAEILARTARAAFELAVRAVGPNAAKPHYSPEPGTSLAFEPGQVFMVDLWGKTAGEPEATYADQTWMGVLAPEAPSDVQAGWDAIVAARDAAIKTIRQNHEATGADADRAARQVLIDGGFEEAIFHRTGHGIDRDIHGVGPTLDSIETRDERRLVEGIGFSVEPGVYLEGRFGLRTEVDVYMAEDGPEVTPSRVQADLWLTG